MTNHKIVADDDEFTTLLHVGTKKLVVCDFSAKWCGPCQTIAPIYQQMSTKYPTVLFLVVDVDKCKETAAQQGVTAMPTFILYRNKQAVDQVMGGRAQELEEKIKKHLAEIESADPTCPAGFVDIVSFIDFKGCECLNGSDETPFRPFIEKKRKLVSDCDEQLILVYGFSQNVKLQSFKIQAPANKAPKTLKLFINQPKTLDFDAASSMTPVQMIELTEEDVTGEKPVELRFVKFQNVTNLQVFIENNLGDEETTEIESLTFYGAPLNTTNMQDFKRVAGEAGESH